MEYYMNEAKKAMDNAVKKITENDYNGAKHFAVKALGLCPELDGLKQLLMMIHVHISAKKTIGNGVPDLYCILGVNPFATTEAVKKQFRKFLLALHPDRNRNKGVEAWCQSAYDLVLKTWDILSDKDKRLEYNIMCGFEAGQGLEPKTDVPNFEGVQNVGVDVGSSSSARTKPTACMDRFFMGFPAFVSEEKISFWTQCNNCNMHLEYPRIYLNKTLLCRICRHRFVAKEMSPPSSVTSSRKEPAPSVQWGSSSRMVDYSNTINATSQAASVQDKLKREFEESGERVEAFTSSDPRNFKRLKTNGSLMHGPLADKTLSQTGASGFSTPNFVLVDGEVQERDDPERVKNWFQERLKNQHSGASAPIPQAYQEAIDELKKQHSDEIALLREEMSDLRAFVEQMGGQQQGPSNP